MSVRQSKRKHLRIDYKKFGDTGIRVPVYNSDLAMDVKANVSRLVGELKSIYFQIDELLDDINCLEELSVIYITKAHSDLKELRVEMVRIFSELDHIVGDDRDPKEKDMYENKLKVSKNSIDIFKLRFRKIQSQRIYSH